MLELPVYQDDKDEKTIKNIKTRRMIGLENCGMNSQNSERRSGDDQSH